NLKVQQRVLILRKSPNFLHDNARPHLASTTVQKLFPFESESLCVEWKPLSETKLANVALKFGELLVPHDEINYENELDCESSSDEEFMLQGNVLELENDRQDVSTEGIFGSNINAVDWTGSVYESFVAECPRYRSRPLRKKKTGTGRVSIHPQLVCQKRNALDEEGHLTPDIGLSSEYDEV
ncbi:hypothetical protein WH47_02451, partial [Habropoda laboriosa]